MFVGWPALVHHSVTATAIAARARFGSALEHGLQFGAQGQVNQPHRQKTAFRGRHQHPQCISTLAVVKRETNSWRYPLLMTAYMFALAYLASFITYRVTLWWGG